VEEKNFCLTKLFGEEPVDGDKIFAEYSAYAERLRPYAANTSVIVNRAAKEKRRSFSKEHRERTSTSTTAPILS